MNRDTTIAADAASSRLDTLDLAVIHEQALMEVLSEAPRAARKNLFNRAGTFFAEAITGIEKNHRTAREAHVEQQRLNRALARREAELAVTNRALKRQMEQRKIAEAALRKTERHFGALLQQSRFMQEQLRHLSRQLLTAHEEERRTMSRELHDEVGQALTSVNVELAALKRAATLNTADAEKRIESARRLVQQSVKIVHQFARELRPSVLDDLGLIPALHSFLKPFSERTGLRVRMKLDPRIETLDCTRRTVLYRVAQEALTNVFRHAKAHRVELTIEVADGWAQMRIKDDGKSFSVEETLRPGKYTRLGLLGMRERVEMVGGRFDVISARGAGTTVSVQIPFRAASGNGAGLRAQARIAKAR